MIVLIAVIFCVFAALVLWVSSRTQRELREVRAMLMVQRNKQNAEHSDEIHSLRLFISDSLALAKGGVSMGLKNITPDSTSYDYGPILLNSQRLVLLVNDGRTWLSVHRDKLRKRFADPNKETTVFLIHPDSHLVRVLARKGSSDVSSVQAKIIESVQLLTEIKTNTTKLEILGHDLFNPFSAVLGDNEAIVMPYFVSRGSRAVPAISYENNGPGCYFSMLEEDLEALRKDARTLNLPVMNPVRLRSAS